MKLIKMTNVSVLLFCSMITVTSCGGSAVSTGEPDLLVNSQMLTEADNDTVDMDPDSANAGNESNGNEYSSEEQNSDRVSSADIVSSEEFLFRGISTLEVHVVIESLKYRRAYINICHQDKDGNLQYDNCLLNAPLKNGQISTDIALANDINELGMTIWQYSPEDDPMEYSWMRSEVMLWTVEG